MEDWNYEGNFPFMTGRNNMTENNSSSKKWDDTFQKVVSEQIIWAEVKI